jgi:long-chain acyl-CoA synthetase
MSLDSVPATSAGRLEPTLVADLVALVAARDGGRDALVETSGRRLTWADLDSEVDRVATGLGDAGVVAGQRVLLAMGNRVELVTTYLAALRAQLVAVPVNPRAKVEGLAWMIADSGARPGRRRQVRPSPRYGRPASWSVRRSPAPATCSTTTWSRAPASPGWSSWLRSPVRRRARLRRAARHGRPPLLTRPDPETLACLLYTGSTVDLPRAAMLTHRALLANIEQTAAVRPAMVARGDVVLGVLPLFHVYGLNAVLGSVLRQGATLVLVDHFDPRGTLDVVAEHGVTVVPWRRRCSRTGSRWTTLRPRWPAYGSSRPARRRWRGP